MTPRRWHIIGIAYASSIYWTVALSLWSYLLVTYGDCEILPRSAASDVAAWQREKALVVWSLLGAIIALYVAGIWLIRFSR
jgi:hypothetical protein